MAKDEEGTELKVGDTVALLCKVGQVWPTETGTNVSVQAILPEGCKETPPHISCNAAFLQKVAN